jgi:hypothetical protein
MPSRSGRPRWAIAARRAAGTLLLCAVVCEARAGQTFDPTPLAARSPSASGATAPARESMLPANLIVPDTILPLVTSMWGRSPTFRRQCARLAEHPDVLVHVQLTVGLSNGTARAVVERDPKRHHVAVQIESRKLALYVEHIAHELEHVLEAMDGADLAHLARQRVDGVRNLGESYETARAQSVGWMVAREVMR